MNRKQWSATAAVLLVLTLVAAACGGGGSDGVDAGGDGSQGATTIEVSLSEFAISPQTIHAPAGRALIFDVTNDGAATHTFAVDTGQQVLATAELQLGDGATLEVPPLEAGEYRTLCTVSGHEDAGMVGTLIVAEDHGAPTR